MKKVALLLILLLPVSFGAYAFWIEPRSLILTEFEVVVPGLGAPVRALVIGDVQPAEPHQTPQTIRAMVARGMALEPDIVLLLGDYVSTMALKTGFIDPVDTVAALAALDAPMGVYAVLGNHDWWWDGPRIAGLLKLAGIGVLRDRAVLASNGGQSLWIAGLEDPVTQIYDLMGTLGQTSEEAPVILLTHTPDVFPEVPAPVALTLAGHTHGGQVNLPLVGRLLVPSRFGQRYAYGLIEEGGRLLYVTSGIGTAILPVRFRTPPEIVLITMTPSPQAASG